LRIIITGATGMVGEGVLLECLENAKVTDILSVSRKPAGVVHAKLKEYIVPDFLSLTEKDPTLTGYDACFFCAGVSSVGMKKEVYFRNTYDTTLAFAHALSPKEKMSFVYVSGAGTDSSETGRMGWARVKGKTENDLMKLPFRKVYAFRPGIMIATKGQKRLLKAYRYFSWMFPFVKFAFRRSINTLKQVAKAMIEAAANGYEKNIVEIRDINVLAKRADAETAHTN
jgi:uncharacterized protein YbjT (DUF2867 family)